MSTKKTKSSSQMDVDELPQLKSKKSVSWTDAQSQESQPKKSKPSATKKSATETFTDLFWHLANVSPEVRIQATATLVETLLSIEKEGKKLAQTKNGFSNVTEEVDYTLARLVKGLLSNRDAARQGFATALSEVLKYLKIDLKEIADLIQEEVVKAKSNPDVRSKDRRLGLIFAVTALTRSGRLTNAFAQPSTHVATLKFTVQLLSELWSDETLKQPQILELTVEAIFGLLIEVPAHLFQSHIHPIFSKALSSSTVDWQPEFISLVLALSKIFHYHPSSDNPQLWNKGESILGPKNLLNLIQPLNVTVRTVPRANKVWDHLLSALLISRDDFSRFCSTILDGLLKGESLDHTYLAIYVVMRYLPNIPHTDLELLLTPELLNILFIHIPKTKSILNDVCKQLLQALLATSRRSSDFALSFLCRLSGAHGDLTVLDHFVKPGVVPQLIECLDSDRMAQYAEFLASEFYEAAVPADLVRRMEVVKTLDVSNIEKSVTAKKSKRANAMEDEDDVVSAPNEHVELQEIRVDPVIWIETRRKALILHMGRIAIMIQGQHVEVTRKILNFIFFHAFYKALESGENSGSASKVSSTPLKASSKKSGTPAKSAAKPSSLEASVLKLSKVTISDNLKKTLSEQLLRLIDALKAPAEETSNSGTKSKKDSSESSHNGKHHKGIFDETPIRATHFWIWPLVQFEKSLLDSSLKFAPNTSGKILDDIRSSAETLMAKIEPVLKVSDETRRTRLEAFQALLIHLHILINIDLEDSIQSLQDLSRVFEELFLEADSKKTGNKTPKSKSKQTEETPSDAPDAVEVFIEILTALLLKAHRALRSVIEQNWLAFSALVNSRAFDIILTALEEEQEAEDDEAVNDEDDLELAESLDSDDLNADELKELNLMLGGSDMQLDEEASGSGSGDEDDQEDNSDEEGSSAGSGSDDEENDEGDNQSDSDSGTSDEDVDALTKRKLREVLEAAGAYQGSDDESEDLDFDDEKMFELDAGLARVAKEIQAAQKAAKRARKNKMTPLEIQATEFRIRLLSLIDLFVEHQSTHYSSPQNAQTVATPSKSPSKSKTSTTSSNGHPWIYFNAIWPLVRVADTIASKKALAPLMDRVLASISRLTKSKVPSGELPATLIETLYEILQHLYAGFNQPSKPSQVELRLLLIVFLQRVLVDQPEARIAKLKEGFHLAMKAYADSTPSAVKSRSLYVDLYTQILRRNPQVQFQLLAGSGEILSTCRAGPMRSAVATALFSTVTKGVVEAAEASADMKAIVKDFLKVFKACLSDEKAKPAHKRDLLLRALDLFKTTLAVNKNELVKAQGIWDKDALIKFLQTNIGSNPLPAVTSALESLTTYLDTGKPKQLSAKYASVEEKYAAKRARKAERQERAKQQAEQRASKSSTSKASSTDSDLELEPAPSKDKKRKSPTPKDSSIASKTGSSSSGKPEKKKAKK